MHQPVFRLPLLAILGLIAWGFSAAAPARAQSGNPELDALLKSGVVFPGGQMRRLRPPSMADGLGAAGQKQAIQTVLAMQHSVRPVNYPQFMVKNLNTPYVLLVDQDPQYDGNQPGHSINLWFVVYGDLKTVADPKFLKKQFKPDNTGHLDTLTPDDLKRRNIVPRTIPAGNEWFVHGVFKLLQTQVLVQVQGTSRAVETTTKESTTLGCQIDRRFDGDSKFPNDWRPAPGGVVQNSPTPYDSFGGYAKVTRLVEPAGALFVEYHLVYDEPQGWFNGANLLRAKLPQATPGDVREFRRDVRTAEQ
ncbi:MAG TPA: hypothetical protein VHX65_17405 [Pirellulales bacterium]|nr:hypothetical protein [Pirellulales bacterium]